MWQRTNVTNLVCHGPSGTYYGRVKGDGKEKWRTLKTKQFSVAMLRLADVERETRGLAGVEAAALLGDTTVNNLISIYRERTRLDPSLAPRTRERRESSIKALLKTWPDLAARDVRRIGPGKCREWAARALREGTGFVAPRAKTKRAGMSSSAFKKVVDVLGAVFEIGRIAGINYRNPAEALTEAPLNKKRLELPTSAQFDAIVKSVRTWPFRR